MESSDIIKLKVGKNIVGVIGLTIVMEDLAEGYAEKPDDLVRQELLTRVSKKNYIPDHAREDYGRAFLREFRKYLGQHYEENPSDLLEVKVLGQGCAQCDQLEKEVMTVLAEMDLAADIEHVKDVKEIGRYGVMGMPALIINGKVMSVGKVPPKNKIKQWVKDEAIYRS
ncbi:thioredoxin family protein [Thermodesulfobacteriota bacterium]